MKRIALSTSVDGCQNMPSPKALNPRVANTLTSFESLLQQTSLVTKRGSLSRVKNESHHQRQLKTRNQASLVQSVTHSSVVNVSSRLDRYSMTKSSKLVTDKGKAPQK